VTHLLDPTAHAEDWLWALGVLLAAVVLGAVLPVLPTGAAVSAMAALAHHRSWLSLGEVVLVATAAAHAGDLVLYAVLLRGSRTRAGAWLHERAGRMDDRLDELGARLARHDVVTLTVSRLLPGARVPVMAAAAGVRYPIARFAVADAVPVACWALAYAGLGLAGRGVSDRPWVGAGVAVLLGIAASGLVGLARRWRAR
jgi:membrane protein DedA with SNARE-associated domain